MPLNERFVQVLVAVPGDTPSSYSSPGRLNKAAFQASGPTANIVQVIDLLSCPAMAQGSHFCLVLLWVATRARSSSRIMK